MPLLVCICSISWLIYELFLFTQGSHSFNQVGEHVIQVVNFGGIYLLHH